jgi:hypothetical protein
VVTAQDSGFTADSVLGGPNAGLWYVAFARYVMDRTTEMNPFIRPGGRADTLTNSTDQRVCRRALGLGANDPVVVNFHTYNTVCRAFSLTPMFDAIWAHEGLGVNNPNDSSLANGHEARRRIAARDPANDPYGIIEGHVAPTYADLRLLVGLDVWDADVRISDFSDPNHAYVAGNYVQGNKCGEAWVFDTGAGQYRKVELKQNAGGTLKCF